MTRRNNPALQTDADLIDRISDRLDEKNRKLNPLVRKMDYLYEKITIKDQNKIVDFS